MRNDITKNMHLPMMPETYENQWLLMILAFGKTAYLTMLLSV